MRTEGFDCAPHMQVYLGLRNAHCDYQNATVVSLHLRRSLISSGQKKLFRFYFGGQIMCSNYSMAVVYYSQMGAADRQPFNCIEKMTVDIDNGSFRRPQA